MPETYSIKVFGCKVNQYNAEIIESSLSSAGYVKKKNFPDFTVVFSCSVTEEARRECISQIKKSKKESGRIYVSGCFKGEAQRGEEILNEIGVEKADYPLVRKRSRPVVSVQEGCVSFCSFCVVNPMRGRSVTRNQASVIQEISMLESSGYPEVVIAGISLGKTEGGFGKFLKKLVSSTESISFRIGSLNPRDIIDDAEFNEMLNEKRVLPHLHLSMQSGSPAVLKDMMRKYEPQEVIKFVCHFRDKRENPGVGVDIIAGFPTESPESHAETMDFLQKLSPSYAHVFPFSARKGTLANLCPDTVGSEERTKRALEIRNMAKNLSRKFLESLVGTTRLAVVERNNGGLYTARTDNYAVVEIISDKYMKNSSKVRIVIESFDQIKRKLKGKPCSE
ncbi:radical SAM protein [candidate division WOR-3 bacterium]|nr:radical SAM protein [candidate division WOR-3 bacterium]